MKLKRLPEDFQVQELSEFAASGSGEFALYRLIKRGLGTPEAVEAVVQRWKLDRRQVSFGGLKDRHAVTTQSITIRRGPRRDLRQTNLELEYIGQAARPFLPSDIAGNRFAVVLRAISGDEMFAAESALAGVRRDGLPNYFDDQRFGSLGESREFVARAWIAGDFERALWRAIADANPLDRPRDREAKRWLRLHWGDWPACRSKLGKSSRGAIVEFLCDRPGDFRGAFVRIQSDQRMLYLAAFQSYLWNRLLAALLANVCAAHELVLVPCKIGELPFFTELNDTTRSQLEAATLPLPSSRERLEDGPIKELVDCSLGELGLTTRELRVKYPRDSFFSKGWRRATVHAGGLEHEAADDELYRGRSKLTIRFEVPRGSYATILVKRITAAAGQPSGEESAATDWVEHEETEATI